jgi:acetylornithine/LysW-gamma-L-lysine aminotransferase
VSSFVLSEKPVEVVDGDGVHLTGADGTEYLDAGASYACVPAGHGHPAVVDAVQEQAADLTFVQGSYPTAVRDALYDRLADYAPAGLENVWLCNSGAEAVEAALKFARSATDGTGLVAAEGAFHGRTMGALSVTHKPKYRVPYEPLLEDVTFVPYGDADALADAVGPDTAAVVLEPVQGEGGVHPAPGGYLAAAREATTAAGAALVLDEIQTGLGRTGAAWACERAGVTPDAVTAAKGLASGLPMGATLCADWLAEGAASHGSTFSGSPVVAAATDATLAAVEEEGLAANAAAVGDHLRSGLADAGFEVRGAGLMIGVEVGPGAAPATLRALALSESVLALPAGRSVVRFLPPLTLTEAHADRLVAALAAAAPDDARGVPA